MSVIQYFFKFYYTIFQNFSSIIKSKDNEILFLKDKINSLNKSNNLLKKKNSKLKLQIKLLNGEVIQKPHVTSISPNYQPFVVDKPPIIKKISPMLDFNKLIVGKKFKVSKIVRNGKMPKSEQCCPKCNSPCEFHSLHTKNQKNVNVVIIILLLILFNKEINSITINFVVLTAKKLLKKLNKKLLYVSAHFNIEFKHSTVAGLKTQSGENFIYFTMFIKPIKNSIF